jgi:hypothetical protein
MLSPIQDLRNDIRACPKDQQHMMRMKFAAMLHSQH